MKKMKASQVIIVFFFLVSAKAIVAARQQQWRGTVLSDVIKGRSAAVVWPLFEDFCNHYEILPVDVSFCVVPIKEPRQRYLATQVRSSPEASSIDSTVTWEKHQLLEMNSNKRFFSYKMIENNQGINTYVPTISILEHKDGSQIKWDFIIDPVKGLTIDDVRNNLKGILAAALVKIEAKLSSST